MAENLREVLRNFALQKMRDLEEERKASEQSSGETKKSSRIKINRNATNPIPVTKELGKSDVQSSSKETESSVLTDKEAKKRQATDLPDEDGSKKVKSSCEDSCSDNAESKIIRMDKRHLENIPDDIDSKKSNTASESDVDSSHRQVNVLKHSGFSGKPEKKIIKITIQTKLLEKVKEPEKPADQESECDSGSSSDNDGNDSEDEIGVVDGLPWRKILEDGELTPSTATEDNWEEGVHVDVKKNDSAVMDSKEKEDKDKVNERKDDKKKRHKDKKKSSTKHKHKGKHKNHKHKKSKKKKKKSKHKTKDESERESKDSKKDGSRSKSTSRRNSEEQVKKGASQINSDEKDNEGINSVSRGRSEEKASKSSSSSRRSSEEKDKQTISIETTTIDECKSAEFKSMLCNKSIKEEKHSSSDHKGKEEMQQKGLGDEGAKTNDEVKDEHISSHKLKEMKIVDNLTTERSKESQEIKVSSAKQHEKLNEMCQYSSMETNEREIQMEEKLNKGTIKAEGWSLRDVKKEKLVDIESEGNKQHSKETNIADVKKEVDTEGSNDTVIANGDCKNKGCVIKTEMTPNPEVDVLNEVVQHEHENGKDQHKNEQINFHDKDDKMKSENTVIMVDEKMQNITDSKLIEKEKDTRSETTGDTEKDSEKQESEVTKMLKNGDKFANEDKTENTEKKKMEDETKHEEKGTAIEEMEKSSKEIEEEKEEGLIESEEEAGEIVKKRKRSKKDKDRRKTADKDRRDDGDRKRKKSRSESRSQSKCKRKRKRSHSKTPSGEDDSPNDSCDESSLVEKAFFCKKKGHWVTEMVPKKEVERSSERQDDSRRDYDRRDRYDRREGYGRRDASFEKRNVFDRLGGQRFDRYSRFDRHDRYRGRRCSYSGSQSRSRSRSPVLNIDKKKLLEIAKANALMRMQAGDIPANIPIPDVIKKAADAMGHGQSIQEFTQRCVAISKTQGDTSSDESPINKPVGSDDEDDDQEKPFVRHPFKVKEAAPIVVNIKNAIQIPVVNKDKLRVQFPVSSGSQHRKKEEECVIASQMDPYGEWKAVENTSTEAKAKLQVGTATTPAVTTATATASMPPAQTTTAATPGASAADAGTVPQMVAPSVPGVANVQPAKPVAKEDKVFADVPDSSFDISAIVSARLKAARALQSNPNNVEALTVLHHSQKQIQSWAHSSQKPGLFTGSTGATILRPEQLGNPNPKNQAWIRKDMFRNAAPVNTHIGLTLMQKMGWKQGEGLGKNKEGQLNPLQLDIKTDRQGLVAEDEKMKKKGDVSKVIRKDLSGKHPVMALNELCNKRHWPKPVFDLVREDGPAHKKNFMFKVRISKNEYQPAVSSGNKKDAKAMAATVALQKMGLIPI